MFVVPLEKQRVRKKVLITNILIENFTFVYTNTQTTTLQFIEIIIF